MNASADDRIEICRRPAARRADVRRSDFVRRRVHRSARSFSHEWPLFRSVVVPSKRRFGSKLKDPRHFRFHIQFPVLRPWRGTSLESPSQTMITGACCLPATLKMPERPVSCNLATLR